MDTDDLELKLTDLNNDCLINVFNQLDHSDLLNVKKTHPTFSDAVDAVCRTTEFEFTIDMKKDENYLQTIRLIDEFLLVYGNQIQASDMRIICEADKADYELVLNRLRALIADRCNTSNITHCSLFDYPFTPKILHQNERFFKALESLTFCNRTESTNYTWLFDFLPTSNLKEFRAVVANQEPFFYELFAKIAASQLTLCRIISFPQIADVSMNIPINHTLRRLYLHGVSFNPILFEQFPNIKDLSVFFCGDNQNLLAPVGGLNKLQRLNLEGHPAFPNFNAFLGEVAKKKALEMLTLSILANNQSAEEAAQNAHHMVTHFCQMRNLKQLILKTNISFQCHFPQIGHSLIDLHTFVFRQLPVYHDHDHDGDTNNTDNEDRDQNFLMGLELVKVAKNLSYIDIRIRREKYQEFYNYLVEIRKSQGNKEILSVVLEEPCDFVASVDQMQFVRGKS